MKYRIVVAIAAATSCAAWYFLKSNPRKEPSKAGQTFAHLLAQGKAAEALAHVAAPKFLADKSPSERDSLIVELLAPEISSEGMEVLGVVDIAIFLQNTLTVSAKRGMGVIL